jgi:hypothetical protein
MLGGGTRGITTCERVGVGVHHSGGRVAMVGNPDTLVSTFVTQIKTQMLNIRGLGHAGAGKSNNNNSNNNNNNNNNNSNNLIKK